MATWDIAREPFTCAGGDHLVGLGEIYRVSRVPRRIGHCEACALRLFTESPPADFQPRDFLAQLRDDIQKHAPRRAPGFSGFDRASVGAELRSNIQAQRKASPTSVRPGRQAAFDPRGQNHPRRHGVVEAIRATTETDWRHRRAGERE